MRKESNFPFQEVRQKRVSRDVVIDESLKSLLSEWKINLSLVAQRMGMRRATLGNKLNGNNGTAFTLEEYKHFTKILSELTADFDRVLKKPSHYEHI